MGTKSGIEKPLHFGLIGENLAHSFSEKYFAKKFESMNLSEHTYKNFEFQNESELAMFLLDDVFKLNGFNVTIPYKESIIPYLDELHETAISVNAVNTVKIIGDKLKGYNTDIYGFLKAFESLIKTSYKKAIILGTGGASKSVAFALESKGISVSFVSRSSINKEMFSYKELTQEVIETHQIIINCTPVGTFPNINDYPDIPYKFINANHLVLDLIYNPAQTSFLKKAEEKGAQTNNGLQMLEFQAEKAWEIWNT